VRVIGDRGGGVAVPQRSAIAEAQAKHVGSSYHPVPITGRQISDAYADAIWHIEGRDRLNQMLYVGAKTMLPNLRSRRSANRIRRRRSAHRRCDRDAREVALT
jgi:hypothetical protein